jgi:molybdopterin converting factor subunit 1
VNVKVLYFALARDLTSTRSEAINVPEGTSVRELVRSLGALHPALGKLKDSVKCSVNLSIVTPETTLTDGDEVGVLPPVAGG